MKTALLITTILCFSIIGRIAAQDDDDLAAKFLSLAEDASSGSNVGEAEATFTTQANPQREGSNSTTTEATTMMVTTSERTRPPKPTTTTEATRPPKTTTAPPDITTSTEGTTTTEAATTTSTTEAATTEVTTTTTSATKGSSWGSDGHSTNNNYYNRPTSNPAGYAWVPDNAYGWVWTQAHGWVWVPWPTYSPTMSPPSKLPTLKPVWPTYSPTATTTAVNGGGIGGVDSDSRPTLSGHSSGWGSDGWTPPDSHLLGGDSDNVVDNETSTNATMMSTDNTTEIDLNEMETFNGTILSDVVNASTTTSTPASTTSTEDTTTSTEATMATTTTTEATTTTTTTTTEATRPPKPTTTTAAPTAEATRPPKRVELNQEINYLGLENGASWFMMYGSVSSWMMAIVLSAMLMMM